MMMGDFTFTGLDLSLYCRGELRERGLRTWDDGEEEGLPRLTLGLPDPIARADSGRFGVERMSFSKAEERGAVETTGTLRKGFAVEEEGDEEEEEEEEEEGSLRKKLRLSKRQAAVLEACFSANATLNGRQKQELADRLNLRPRQVEVWFQNRRARTKLKQTEADREMLRKCCETLKEDNARLKMELRRLRDDPEEASTVSSVSVCPSCETSFQLPFSPADGCS